MINFTIRIFGNSLALYIASFFITGFTVSGGIKEYLLAGIFLGLLNLVVKPVLKLISLPLIILTLGLFTLVINAVVLWTVDYLFDFILIQDVYTLVWGTIVVSIVNMFVSGITKTRD